MYDNCIPEVGELYSIWDKQFFVAPEAPVPPPQMTMDEPPAQTKVEEPPAKEEQKIPEPLHDFEFVEINDATKTD